MAPNSKKMSVEFLNNQPIEGQLIAGRLYLSIQAETQKPEPSASGKTLVVASSHGNRPLAGCDVLGRVLTVGVNAYVKP